VSGREQLSRVLVAGGAGFLGSHLVERLVNDGVAVDVVDDLSTGALAHLGDARAARERAVSIHTLDVRAPGLVELAQRRQPDVVVHLAQRSAADPDDRDAAELALVGTMNVLDAARAAGARKVVLVFDGADVYGEVGARELPVKEGQRSPSVTTGQVVARALLDLAAVHRARHALEFTALALADVYGPRQRPESGLIAALVADPSGRAIDPRAQLDAVYVDDAVDAIVRATVRGTGLLVNIGTGQAVPAKEVQRRIVELRSRTEAGATDGPVPTVVLRPRPQRLTLSPVRARIHLGWEAYTPLAEGLAATMAWWAERPAPAPGPGVTPS
jgi:UDP-glucose 4-epimerase